MDLTDRRVIVLGGTSGIGLATALAAAGRGALVTVASSRRDTVEAAVKTLPPGSRGVVCDARDEKDVQRLFAETGPFDHLVFTAGDSLLLDRIEAITSSDARGAFEIRFWGAWLAAKYAKEHLRPGGSIILSSGIAAGRPPSGGSVVAPVCAAVEALTRALAVELAPIRVNAVAAGMVDTDLWADVPAAARAAIFAEARRTLPARTTGEPADIAEAHLHLMTARFTTGTVLTIDGGATLT
ncbi:SDR family oxidoreductase [Streptomyces sp. NPDC005953]|uniref:SDR family oxidoreductase n=1 Tax=Streptomyces sp. NPDC005953 TaxID=3156719 RepID=UPI003404CB67